MFENKTVYYLPFKCVLNCVMFRFIHTTSNTNNNKY